MTKSGVVFVWFFIGALELTSAAFVQFFLSYSANIRASLEVFGVCVTCCMARVLAKMANQLRITLACDVANLQREHAKKPGGSRWLQSAAVPSWEPDTRAICAVSVRYDEAS